MRKETVTVRTRLLGLALRKAMRANGTTAKQTAQELGWSETKICRLLLGIRLASAVDLATLLARCGIVGPARDALLELAQHAAEPVWCQEYGERLPIDLTTVHDLEDSAVSLTCVDAITVPTLLQTENYRRSLLQANPVIPSEEIDDRLAHHQKRQHILDRDDVNIGCNDVDRNGQQRFQFFLDERVLSSTSHDRDIMSDQVHHLLRTSIRPDIELRVIPAGSRVLGTCPPFQLMTFTDLHPVVYLEHLNSTIILERQAAVAGYQRIVTDMNDLALDDDKTRAWLTTLAATLSETPFTFQAKSSP